MYKTVQRVKVSTNQSSNYYSRNEAFPTSKIKQGYYVYLRISNFIVESCVIFSYFFSISTDNEDNINKEPDVAIHESRAVFFLFICDYLEFLCSRLYWATGLEGKRLDGVVGDADELPDLLLSSLKSSLDELRASFSI
jgi:hypothetical protein